MEYQVIFDYIAKEKDELSIKSGDIIQNVVQKMEGWFEGNLNGKSGLFPDNFVKVVATTSDNSIPTKSNTNQIIRPLKVLFDYSPQDDDELSLKEGDIIYYANDVENGWWEGTLNGKLGVFPSNFVTEMNTHQSNDNNMKAKPEEKLNILSKQHTSDKEKDPSRLLQEYTITGLLGSGNFGTVIECSYNLDRHKYAIKITPSNDNDFALKEVQNLVAVPGHKNIVQYFTCWKDTLSNDELKEIQKRLGINSNIVHKLSIPSNIKNLEVICMQMELCGNDLRTNLNKSCSVNEKQAINIFVQLVKGVEHLHKYGIIHRDLKPENIFTSCADPSIVKIGDLGIATSHTATHSLLHSQATGTRLYFAPEQEGSLYGKSIDIYALGIIFLELLHPSVQPGFNGNSYQPLIEMVTALKFDKEIPSEVKTKWPVASNVILKMTSVNSTKRPNCGEIVATFLTNGVKAESRSQRKIRHLGVSCNGCGIKDIEGVRYKCNVCKEYDLCEGCEARNGIHPESHPLIKIKSFTKPISLHCVDDKVGQDLNNLKLTDKSSVSFKKHPIFNPISFPIQDTGYKGNGCFRCHEKVSMDKDFFHLENRNWHKYCFYCTACGCTLEKQFEKAGNNYYCETDYKRYFEITPICNYCKNPCLRKWKNVNGLPFHFECFKCPKCGQNLEKHWDKEKAGKNDCSNSYHNYKAKCIKCLKPCLKFVTVDGEKLHEDCYTCCMCNIKLKTHYKQNGKIYCIETCKWKVFNINL